MDYGSTRVWRGDRNSYPHADSFGAVLHLLSLQNILALARPVLLSLGGPLPDPFPQRTHLIGARWHLVKKLLILVLSVSCLAFVGSASPSSELDSSTSDRSVVRDGPFRPHLEIPRNCIQTQQADGSVLVTCDCEACGHPEARDGLNPLPWGCELKNQTVTCGYDVGRRHLNGPRKTHI
jgi:hypothetical protein